MGKVEKLACVVLVAAGEPSKGAEAGTHSLHSLFSEKIAYFVQRQVLELLPRPAPTQTLHHLPVEDRWRVLHQRPALHAGPQSGP